MEGAAGSSMFAWGAGVLNRVASSLRLGQQVRFATKKAGGTGGVTRTSNPKYLGPKKYELSPVVPGNIILLQRGSKWRPGLNVRMGRDHTLYALTKGFVEYHRSPRPNCKRKWVHVHDLSLEENLQRMRALQESKARWREKNGTWTRLQQGAFADR